MERIHKIIEELDLKPHPEGGYFKEEYRSSEEISKECLPPVYNGPRNHATAIYFLLTSENFSAFHRIKQDEIWHYYDGSPILLHCISEEGLYSQHLIGNNLSKGERPQFVVPGGHWFAAEVSEDSSFSLVGCTVSPGFSFEDFEMPSQEELLATFPQHHEIILRLTHS